MAKKGGLSRREGEFGEWATRQNEIIVFFKVGSSLPSPTPSPPTHTRYQTLMHAPDFPEFGSQPRSH